MNAYTQQKKTCATPRCTNHLSIPPTGRHPKYCNSCRRKAYRKQNLEHKKEKRDSEKRWKTFNLLDPVLQERILELAKGIKAEHITDALNEQSEQAERDARFGIRKLRVPSFTSPTPHSFSGSIYEDSPKITWSKEGLIRLFQEEIRELIKQEIKNTHQDF